MFHAISCIPSLRSAWESSFCRTTADATLFHALSMVEASPSKLSVIRHESLVRTGTDERRPRAGEVVVAANIVVRLADLRSKAIVSYLTPHELLLVRARNSTEVSAFVDHAHDFCDANMAIDEAFREIFGRAIEDDDLGICSAACELSKILGYR